MRTVSRSIRPAACVVALLLAAVPTPLAVYAQGHDGAVDVTLAGPAPEKPPCLLSIPRIHPPQATIYDEMRKVFEQPVRRKIKKDAVQAINDLQDAVERLNGAAKNLEDDEEKS